MKADMNPNNNEINFHDPEVYKVLKSLGFLIPQTIEDFKKLDEIIQSKNIRIKTPKIENFDEFINSASQFTFRTNSTESSQSMDEIISGFAQAAREGKQIPEHIQNQMNADKKNKRK